tara:strand:- start:202 stop:339 length:138 start_codon:yes stop_codon:yes gene_type:complete
LLALRLVAGDQLSNEIAKVRDSDKDLEVTLMCAVFSEGDAVGLLF